MSQQNEEGIDLSTLSVEQLGSFKEQLEGDLERFTESFSSLQTAANRFHNSGAAAEGLAKEEEGKPMMVPLTSSLYVKGTLGSVEKVLIDVGTGYYVEKSPLDGMDFCRRKVLMLKENMERLHMVMFEKRKQLNQVSQVHQAKLAQRGPATQKA